MKHIPVEIQKEIKDTLKIFYTILSIKYSQTLKMIGLTRSTYYNFSFKKSAKRQGYNFNKIRGDEKKKVIEYANNNGNYFHRELTYRLIDENIAYMSPSSVYRTLKKANLIQNKNKMVNLYEYYNPHEMPKGPDEKWQSDITYIRYQGKDYYLLTLLDIFSRYIPYYQLLTDMTSDTVSRTFAEYLKKVKFEKKPILQTDNGSCYIGSEFKNLMIQYNFEHKKIKPHCPNQNAEIERSNRTLKEGLSEHPIPKSFEELKKNIEKVIDYYNHKRYHKSLNYLPPIIYY